MLLRVRVTSFLCGFAVAGGAAMAAIRNDVLRSAELVAAEARRSRGELEGRISRLEALLGAGPDLLLLPPAPGPAKAEVPSAPPPSSDDAIGLASSLLVEAAAAGEVEAGAAAAAATALAL